MSRVGKKPIPLPKGVKQMLLITESGFFEEARPPAPRQTTGARPVSQAAVLPDARVVHWLNHPPAADARAALR